MSWLSNRRAAAAAARKRTTQEHIARHEEGISDFLADKEANAPKNWGAAYKAAGGGQKAAILAGANTAVGAVIGGGIDAAVGDDSWVDGAAVGAGLGAVGGIGAFAKSVHSLKVGKMTKSAVPANGLASNLLTEEQLAARRSTAHKATAAARNSMNSVKVSNDIKRSVIDPSALSLTPKGSYGTKEPAPFNYEGALDFNLTETDKNHVAASRLRSAGIGW